MTLRLALRDLNSLTLVVLVLSGAAALALVIAPAAALALVFVVFAALFLPRFRPEHLLAAVLAYLPFENQALTYAPANATPFIRYSPEILIDLAVLLIVFGNLDRVLTGLGKLRWPLALLISTWLASAVWAGIALTTASIGFRSELRFLPLLFVAVLSRKPDADARLYGRTLVFVATIESVIVGAQAVLGAPARNAFAPKWTIEINGISFADGGLSKPDTNFGTFSNYNAVGVFLLCAWIILAAAGSRRLGFPNRVGLALGTVIAGATLLSGSREAGLALGIAAVIIAHVRYRQWVSTAVVLGSVLLILGGPIIAAAHYGIPEGKVNGHSLAARWAYVMSPEAWSTDYQDNFRLFLLKENTDLIAQTSPAFGFGIGSVSDKRTIQDGSNPLYRTWAGRRALTFSYLYDGNWGLLVMEVGFVGLFALAWLFMGLFRVALQLMRTHWLGVALLAQLVVVVVLGFFAPIMQLRIPTAMLWLTAGLSLALLQQRKEQESLEAVPSVEPELRVATAEGPI
jgi:hypothetical protein